MNGQDLCRLSAVEVAATIRSGKTSALDVTESVLARIDELNPVLNMFCTRMDDEARRTAEGVDKSLAAGKSLGPLAGVPVSIKENVAVAPMVIV